MIITKGDATYAGVIEKDGKIVCEKCGKAKVKFVSHMDAADWFANTYKCSCGNEISITTKRDGKGMFR